MFGLIETSRTLGEPVKLYYVKYGEGASDFLALTNSEDDLTLAGVTYRSTAIHCDDITASGSLDKSSFLVYTAMNSPLVDLFRLYPPERTVSLTISQGHRNDPASEFKRIWSGRVLSFSFQGAEAQFTCEPAGTSLRRPGLRRTYTYGCPYVLFGTGCEADRGAATVHTSVDALDGSYLTLPADWFGAFPAAKFQGGIASWTRSDGATIERTILSVADTNAGPSTQVLLSGPATGLSAGMSVAFALNCNHQMDDCEDLHHNILRYGGCPWIPLANPIGSRNNFY